MPPARIAFWAATVAGIAFTVRSVLTEPPSLTVSAACACAYFALLIAGILWLRLGMFADALIHGPSGATGVALTFEGALEPTRTRELLDALDAHEEAKATFFVAGVNAEEHRALVEELVSRGHDLGIVGFVRDRFMVLRGTKRVQSELERAVRAIENITEKAPLFFRPPMGHTNPTMARLADRLDLTMVGWSARAGDTTRLEDGAIVRIADAKELATTLDKLASKNLRVTKLSAWLDDA